MVGASGFEPPASWSRTRRASQAALRPELLPKGLSVYDGIAAPATVARKSQAQRSILSCIDGAGPALIRRRRRLALVRAHNGHVHQMFRQEPNLQFVGANHIGHQQIVRAVVSGLARLPRHGPRLF
jgi:hypothetical protein